MRSLYDSDNIKNSLPSSIAGDKTVLDICDSIQPQFDEVFADRMLLLLLPNLDNLSEALVDELAWQYHVDFYRDNYPLETKRKLVRTAIERHRRKGTPASVEEMVSTVYQNAKVEEWWEWDGDPYYFRVLLRAQTPAPPLSLTEVIKLIEEYKSKRSWLEGIYYHIPHDLVIGTHFGYVCYWHRRCGTYPYWRRYGSIEDHGIVVDTEKGGLLYDNPHSGEISAGMFPRRTVAGDMSDDDLVIETEKGGMLYENPRPGEISSGMFPGRPVEGEIMNDEVPVETEKGGMLYDNPHTGVIRAGTVPARMNAGGGDDGGILANTAVSDIPYSVRYCGSPLGSIF
jgi:phage tail P2-like protein